jgi:hypothetical protein
LEDHRFDSHPTIKFSDVSCDFIQRLQKNSGYSQFLPNPYPLPLHLRLPPQKKSVVTFTRNLEYKARLKDETCISRFASAV